MNEYEENLFQIDFLSDHCYSRPYIFDNCSNDFLSSDFSFNVKKINDDQQIKIQMKTEDLTNTNNLSKDLGKQKLDLQQSSLQIQVVSNSILKTNKIIKGCKNDTIELNINFKTILVNHFKQLLLLNELTFHQRQSFQTFNTFSPSFRSLAFFCKNTSIRNRIVQLIESKTIIIKIFKSRAHMKTKLQMLKFIEIFRKNVLSQKGIIRWKQLQNRFL